MSGNCWIIESKLKQLKKLEIVESTDKNERVEGLFERRDLAFKIPFESLMLILDEKKLQRYFNRDYKSYFKKKNIMANLKGQASGKNGKYPVEVYAPNVGWKSS